MNIVTLTLNPAVDIHCTLEELRNGEENKATVTGRTCSGKGVNVSRVLGLLGVRSTALVVLGSENGEDFRRELEKEGINGVYFTVPGRIRENITVHPEKGPETRLCFTGISATPDLIERTDALMEPMLQKGDYLVFSGSNPVGTDISQVKKMLKKYISRGIHTVIDSKSMTPDDIYSLKPWLIKPNEEEIGYFLGHRVQDTAEAGKLAGEIQRKGIENVMITFGAGGGLLCCRDGVYFSRAIPDRPILSTIGAGDSSVAGFICAKTAGKSPEECLIYAMCCGTAACMTEGTLPPLTEDVERLYSRS